MTSQSLSGFTFTFLHGVRVRSGTNYVGKMMSCNAHVQLVPPGKTTDEFPFVRDLEAWEKGFSNFVSKFKGDKNLFQFRRFLPHLGSAWLTYLIDTFSLRPGHVFLKDPSVRHIDRFFDLFPDAKLILLVRDGRDNVASSVKAGLATRAHQHLAEKAKTRLNHLLLRDFVTAARDWSSAVRTILRFDQEFKKSPHASRYLILRYEDIYQNPRQLAERLFAFMGVPCDGEILDSVENAEVVGSSFYSSTGQEDARKPNWIPTPKTEAFQPVGRWKEWNAVQRGLFKRIAGDQLIAMGYERDLNWQ
jgi:Sulfotransferase family